MPRLRHPQPALRAGATLLLSLAVGTASAAVSVQRGPTPNEGGEAQAAGDITLRNDQLVVTIAAESAPPWGVAPGGIVDAAPVVDGELQRDLLSLVDLIPNNWSSWPTSYQRFEIVKDGPKLGVVRVERDWGEVELVSTYTLASGSDSVHLTTTMTNTGDEPRTGLLSGYVLWPNGGDIFGMPGLMGVEEGPADAALADWAVVYAEDWAVALHAPYAEYIDYEARDLYLRHTLEPGESQKFEAWFQVLPSGDLASVVQAEIARTGAAAGTLTGQVTTAGGELVAKPVVVIKQDGEPYAFTTGREGQYRLRLPAGEYTVYATARHYARGDAETVTVEPGATVTANFNGLAAPGKVRFAVSEAASERPLDARIAVVEGQTPLIAFLGQKTFFTELQPVGELSVPIAPGGYVFQVAHGDDFLAEPARVKVTVEPGETAEVPVTIEQLTHPNQAGWYCADMHHHSDVLDGFTPPEYVVRSQLAVGLDLTLLSDHGSTRNLAEMARLSAQRGVPFIPAMEISPSWGHFIPYPIEIGSELTINSGTAPIDAVLAQEEALGAMAIQVNHPYIAYGYYNTLETGAVPGGYNAGYDLIEINADGEYEKTLRKVREHWSHGERYYLSAGSDVHDVWEHRSGEIRACAHLLDQPTTEGFVASLRDGRAFVSFGPLVYPEIMFGSDLHTAPERPVSLGFTLESANGLKRAALYSADGMVAERSFQDAPVREQIRFEPTPAEDTWYALVVEDTQGLKAYTNPVWVDVTQFRPVPAAEDE